MNWLPKAVDFGSSLRAALAIEDPDRRLDCVTELSQCQLNVVETIQLDNALATMAGTTSSGYMSLRLAVLSSCTVDHLLPGIRVAGRRHGFCIETYTGGFGQYRQELLDHTSPLHKFDPDAVLLSLSSRDITGEVPLVASVGEAKRVVDDVIAELRRLWRKASECFDAIVIQQSFLDLSDPLFGSYDRCVPGSPAAIVARLNDRLIEALSAEGVLLLDVERASRRDGIANWFDVGRWLQARMEIAPQAAPTYGEMVVGTVAAQRGRSKKCLVLDLDNTLWSGVVGDDGLDGITIGEGSPVGEAHLALQRYAKRLRERGVILAVCSKNDLATAESVFLYHPEMLLKRSDISIFVANWRDKVDNLRSIASALDVGLESMVFVDDSPAERARVRQALPVVAVPELPADVADYVRCIANAGYFEAVSFTAEDQERAALYASNASRNDLRAESEGVDAFLAGLEMSVIYSPLAAVDLRRATQLVNKTNQFNTTARRYTDRELSRLAAAPENVVLQFRLVDRFGDNGLVSVMVVCADRCHPEALTIACWVMSCRVFGRELEDEAMNIAVECARHRGVRTLRAEFVPTDKNSVISGLYQKLGFVRCGDEVELTEKSVWVLSVDDYASRRTFISRETRKT